MEIVKYFLTSIIILPLSVQLKSLMFSFKEKSYRDGLNVEFFFKFHHDTVRTNFALIAKRKTLSIAYFCYYTFNHRLSQFIDLITRKIKKYILNLIENS